MPTQSISLKEDNWNNLRGLCAMGQCSSLTDALNKITEAMFAHNYPITLNGSTKNIREFMVSNPYVRADFTELGVTGKFGKKFITNFNRIRSGILKKATYNLIKEAFAFIGRKYITPAKVGSLENLAIYYYSNQNNNYFWIAMYFDVKNAKKDIDGTEDIEDTISISRFLQLKLRNRYVNNTNNLLWDLIQIFFAGTHGVRDVYSLNAQQINLLIEYIKQA